MTPGLGIGAAAIAEARDLPLGRPLRGEAPRNAPQPPRTVIAHKP